MFFPSSENSLYLTCLIKILNFLLIFRTYRISYLQYLYGTDPQQSLVKAEYQPLFNFSGKCET
jgi:hypothetical protein